MKAAEDMDRRPEEPEDFENCKGRCGYTIWCRECMANREKEGPPQPDPADGPDDADPSAGP